MGRPLGPSGGRDPGGGGTGRPDGLSGGRTGRCCSGAAGGAAVSAAFAAGACCRGRSVLRSVRWALRGARRCARRAAGDQARPGGRRDSRGAGGRRRDLAHGCSSLLRCARARDGTGARARDGTRARARHGTGARRRDCLPGHRACRRGGRSRLGLRRLLAGRRRLVGLDGATQSFGIRLAADAVGLRVLNGGRVALDPDPQGQGQLETLLVGKA